MLTMKTAVSPHFQSGLLLASPSRLHWLVSFLTMVFSCCFCILPFSQPVFLKTIVWICMSYAPNQKSISSLKVKRWRKIIPRYGLMKQLSTYNNNNKTPIKKACVLNYVLHGVINLIFLSC